MKLMDCVEVIVEKTRYAKEGVHKGMQGIIWEAECKNGSWVVLFPQCGDKEDIADIYISEEDLCLLPDGMDAKVNEQIKAQLETDENATKSCLHKPKNLSDYMI